MSQGRSRCPLPPPAPQWTIQSELVRARDGPERLARAYRAYWGTACQRGGRNRVHRTQVK